MLRFLLTSGLLLALGLLARRTKQLRGETMTLVPSPDAWTPIPEVAPGTTAPAPEAATTPAPEAATDLPEAAAEPAAPVAALGPAWVVANEDGSCPPTHPIKAKAASGIYHLPGMANYQRTRADRCYADEAAATADGFTPAKR